MLQGEVRLLLQGQEKGGLQFQAGFPQGCPLNCFLFVICVDPLLTAMRKAANVKAASGFVDYWAAACVGKSFDQAAQSLVGVLELVGDFERASGSTINRSKSAIVPSRNLSAAEIAACQNVGSQFQ